MAAVHLNRRSIVVAAAGAVAALLFSVSTAASATLVTRYVALGDSYSSGVGAGSYIASSGTCLRSTRAYSQLWANAHSPASYASLACSGATTADVANTQLSALGTGTTLVSITIGGNDVGFASVLEDCVLYGTSACVSDINTAENAARTVLPGRLDALYNQISADAPSAKVVVLSYPRFYDTGAWFCIGLSGTSRSKINEGADVLDGVISAAAARHGFTFADVRSRFGSGHEICDGSSSWLHSLDLGNLTQSYHPTASGQSGGYYPAFSSAST